jgi:ATP-binding cassette subfamily C protein
MSVTAIGGAELSAQAPAAAAAPASGSPLRLRAFGVTPLYVLTIVLLTVAAQIGMIGFVMLLMHITDGVVETRNGDTLIAFATLFAFIVILSGVFQHIRATMLAAVAERFGLKLRAEAMQAAIRNAVRTETADGLAVLGDIQMVQRFIGSRAPTAFLELIGGLIALFMLFYFDEGLGWIGVAGLLVLAVSGGVMHFATKGLVKQARGRLSETNSEISGQLVHPDLVRGLGMLPATMFRWQDRYDGALESLERAQRRVDALAGMQDLLSEFYYMAVKAFACYLIFIHIGSLGLMLGAYHFCGSAIHPFANIARSWENWAFVLQSWRRLDQVMRTHGEAKPKPVEPEAPPGLVLEDAGFWPEGRESPVLSNVSVTVPPGTAMIVVGPNGVGKSTLLRLALGLMQPTTGRALLDGQDTHHCDRAALGAQVGYLPQDVQLLEGPVYDNIGRGPEAPSEAVVEAARAAGAHDMIGRLPLGYQTPAGSTSGLSAGQRRLIGLARALYGKPRLLVLDEPFALRHARRRRGNQAARRRRADRDP